MSEVVVFYLSVSVSHLFAGFGVGFAFGIGTGF
jgi:hypothetical protein